MSTPPPSDSSSSSSTNSPSPTTPHAELNSDPSEALEFLLQTMVAQAQAQASNGDSSSSFDPSTQPDWSQLASWASAAQEQKFDMTSDFSFSLPMDLDFDPNMAVDPSALHFTTIFDQSAFTLPPNEASFLMSNEMVPNNMLFPSGEDFGLSHVEAGTGRRLSITSSSSSSGASLSPIMEPSQGISGSPPSDVNLNDPASELAQRVRQMAGVTLAVPVSAQVQQLAAAGGQAKLPIPRLKQSPTPAPAPKRTSKPSPPPSEVAASPSSSTSSPPSTTPISEQTLSPVTEILSNAPTQSVIGRPKTSHTTIERRYRTNLNARITGLKQSVPALRVLEAKAGQPTPWNDVVDTRGFVDGVKVARKMSKANILGKATEYIRVLKKRESRLKREQDGLKSLITGLVGGPALLKEWEREWRERFGGEEKDEIEDDDAAGSDDEEGDGDDSDGDDDEGRARKKAKVAKAAKKEKPYRPPPPPPVPGVPGAVPEKRKRGRPRKIPLPTSAAPSASVTPAPSNAQPIFPTDQTMHDAFMPIKTEQMLQQPQQPATQQYLLAVFAFFSVFNSPLASSSRSPHAYHDHAHHGVVLTPHQPTATHIPVSAQTGYGLHEVAQAAHLLVSTLVFFYVLVPWFSESFRKTGIRSRVISVFSRTKQDSPAPSASFIRNRNALARSVLLDALSPAARGSEDEPAQLCSALGITTGVIGLLQSVIKAARRDRGIELNQLEQRAWVRLGELIAFDGSVGNTTRLQTFWCMSWHISTFAATTSDLSTLALIIRPVSGSKATELWERARKREVLRAHEKIVLNNMSVEGAADWLAKWRSWHESERKGRCTACEKRTPLGILAAILIRERLRKHAASLFVRTVVRAEVEARRANPAYDSDDECDDPMYTYDADKDFKEEQERKETVEAGKSIGGRTSELAVLLERIWDTGFFSSEDTLLPAPRHAHAHGCPDVDADCEDEQDLASQDEAEIRALLTATLIYRRIFPSTIPACTLAGAPAFVLSPPPSPSRRNAKLHMALRTALGSPAFESGADGRLEDPGLGAALEDARDRVVDMLVDFERACRRGGRAFD
ncbi:transcription factor [Ganoderma sinense ZZ0214-1]|uniref:Transcription factor n=1 Tax=Ganoderma sinense ZZ0214-1 TaxID=1077348 RepID=A0A2G8S1U2_9APHY|nr:transcription factor [Ganoderma sinense ZZ0214-1]